MRHLRKRHRIGRGASHRKATLASMSTALIRHKRITTTLAKAKALRVYVEPILNRAKTDTTHNHREVFRHLQDKDAIKTLFGEIAEKIADRPGGYTRIVKLGMRAGDAAEMAIIELVDYNETDGSTGGRKKARRSRRGRRGTSAAASKDGADATAPAAVAAKETPVAVEEADASNEQEAETVAAEAATVASPDDDTVSADPQAPETTEGEEKA